MAWRPSVRQVIILNNADKNAWPYAASLDLSELKGLRDINHAGFDSWYVPALVNTYYPQSTLAQRFPIVSCNMAVPDR